MNKLTDEWEIVSYVAQKKKIVLYMQLSKRMNEQMNERTNQWICVSTAAEKLQDRCSLSAVAQTNEQTNKQINKWTNYFLKLFCNLKQCTLILHAVMF